MRSSLEILPPCACLPPAVHPTDAAPRFRGLGDVRGRRPRPLDLSTGDPGEHISQVWHAGKLRMRVKEDPLGCCLGFVSLFLNKR